MVVFVAANVLGLLVRGRFSKRMLANPDRSLEIRYEQTVRFDAPTPGAPRRRGAAGRRQGRGDHGRGTRRPVWAWRRSGIGQAPIDMVVLFPFGGMGVSAVLDRTSPSSGR